MSLKLFSIIGVVVGITSLIAIFLLARDMSVPDSFIKPTSSTSSEVSKNVEEDKTVESEPVQDMVIPVQDIVIVDQPISEPQIISPAIEISSTKSIATTTSETPQNLIENKIIEPIQSEPITTPIILEEQVIPELPARLKIPAISVNAPVEFVGLTPDGSMDIPKNPDNVAWFEPWLRPGEIGSAVIAGHLDRPTGKPAVFYDLSKLRKGDKLYIEDEKGATITFVVREIRSYDQKADALGIFTSKDGKSHLNLITCEGTWSRVNRSYSNRLVVFSDRI